MQINAPPFSVNPSLHEQVVPSISRCVVPSLHPVHSVEEVSQVKLY